MKLRKMLAIGLTTMSMVGLTALTATAAGEKVASYDFEGDNSAWYNGGEGDGTTITNVIHQDVTENGNTFRRMGFDVAVTGTDNQVGNVLHMPATSITLPETITFEDGKIIKVSSKIRSNQFGSSARVMPGIAMNVPEKAYKKEVIETLSNGVHVWNRFFNNLYKVDYSSNGSKVFHNASGVTQYGRSWSYNWGNGYYIPNSDQVTTSNLSANTWYEVDTYLTIGVVDEVAQITKIRTVVNDGKLGDVETVVNSVTNSKAENNTNIISKETSLNSLHLYTSWRSGAVTKAGVTVDFDDIEVTVFDSAEELGNEPYYIDEDYKFGYVGWSKASNKGTDTWVDDHNPNHILTITPEDGVLKMSAPDTGNNGQYDLVGLHRTLPKAITPSTDKDFVVKTRIRNTCENANIQFMINRDTAWNGGYLQGKNRYNTFFDLGTNSASFRGSDSAKVPGYKDFAAAYTGATLNKWFDVEFYFDSSDQTIYGSVKDEAGNVYSLVNQTDWTVADITSFSIVMYDKDDDVVYDEDGNATTDESGATVKEYKPVSFELASFEFYEVSNAEWVAVADENGNEVTEIKAGDKVCAKYNFKPAYEDIIKYYAMTALYSKDENGALKLEKVEVKDLGSNMGYYNGTTEAITIPEEGEYVVKAFIWNSASLKPMMANDEV